MSEERRSQGLCPLTPEEVALVLKALGFGNEWQIYIAAGDIYGGERRLAQLRASFPRIVSSCYSVRLFFLFTCIFDLVCNEETIAALLVLMD